MANTLTGVRLERHYHGASRTPIYRIWGLIKQRTCNPTHIDYPRYGGRGIETRNRRNTHLFSHDGHTATLSEWAERLGVNRSTLAQRIYVCGWDVDAALSTPVRPRRSAA